MAGLSGASRPTCGLVIWESKREVGSGAYSPGLEYDAQVYREAFTRVGVACVNISPWSASSADQARVDQLISQ